jgi:hypothetical protein
MPLWPHTSGCASCRRSRNFRLGPEGVCATPEEGPFGIPSRVLNPGALPNVPTSQDSESQILRHTFILDAASPL